MPRICFTINVFGVERFSSTKGVREIVVLSEVAFFTISEIASWFCSEIFAICRISSDVKNASHLPLKAKKTAAENNNTDIFFILL